jgi:hypothetical protein
MWKSNMIHMRNIVFLLLAMLTLNACNIFELRDAEPPSEEARWNDITSSWQLLLDNLIYAYEDSRNAINYGRIFLSEYRFYFAQQDITDYSTDQTWTTVQEQDMLLNLHARYREISLNMQDMDAQDEISSTEVKLYRAYEITATPEDPDRDQVVAKGRLELHLRRVNGYWYIYSWKDYRSSGERTWGLLKHENG